MKMLLTAAIVLLATGIGQAQYLVKGSVKDLSTQEALPSAHVFLDGNTAVTDRNGEFAFTNISEGDHTLKVTFVGYKKYEQTLTINKNRYIEVGLLQDVLLSDEVIVSATRASEKTPTTFSVVDREEIEENNLGQDLPFLLNWTPSLVTTSDAGTGIGYTGLRIRGSDATRINVTINGIPLNDSESQGVFWVDIPDIASSTENIQIQRGIGTSTNGAGAFGGTINLQTNITQQDPYGEIINSYGSFNTWRHTVGFGTGRIQDRWSFNGRLSKITSDGYIDRATSDLQSYYLSGGFYGKKTMVKAIVFGGKERTYQSWYGTPEAVLKNDLSGIEEVITNNWVNEEQAENLRTAGRTFNWYLYENEVDDYQQDHYQLHLSHQIADHLTASTALHYTYGRGFYEQFRENDDFASYGLADVSLGDTTITSADIIRRRWLDNDFYGFTYSFDYNKERLNVILGGAYNTYHGNHFGEIIWSEYASNAFIGDRYYDNDGDKTDFNTFLKVIYQLTDNLNVFGDIQFRNIQYDISGIDNDLRSLDVSESFDFVNPKFGLFYTLDETSGIYASYAMGNREPVRSDFIDSPIPPKHETLRNLEAGYRKKAQNYDFQANYYLMDYKNQLVLTGALNDVGGAIRTNVTKSYRTGVELSGSVEILDKIFLRGNVSVSKNKIEEYREMLNDYADGSLKEQVYKDTDISFSPNVIAASQVGFRPMKGLEVSLLSKYVGDQYLDNTSNENRRIDAYFVNDARLTYSLQTDFIREIGFTLQVNNVFNELYSSNGYTFGYYYGSEVRENYYYPQATRNFMLSATLKF